MDMKRKATTYMIECGMYERYYGSPTSYYDKLRARGLMIVLFRLGIL